MNSFHAASLMVICVPVAVGTCAAAGEWIRSDRAIATAIKLSVRVMQKPSRATRLQQHHTMAIP
jgi:hypothetical protein